jgi:hypothetical protein
VEEEAPFQNTQKSCKEKNSETKIASSNISEVVQVTNTDDRPDLSSEGAPYTDKTVNVEQKLISGHEPQMGLDTKTD